MRKISWLTVLVLLLTANLLDYFSTSLLASKMGTDYEGNSFMRHLMQLGWRWFATYKLGVLSVVFTLLALAVKRIHIFSVALIALAIMLFLVALHNIVLFMRFSG